MFEEDIRVLRSMLCTFYFSKMFLHRVTVRKPLETEGTFSFRKFYKFKRLLMKLKKCCELGSTFELVNEPK